MFLITAYSILMYGIRKPEIGAQRKPGHKRRRQIEGLIDRLSGGVGVAKKGMKNSKVRT